MKALDHRRPRRASAARSRRRSATPRSSRSTCRSSTSAIAEAWRALDGEFDAAFLNAGHRHGDPDVAELPDERVPRAIVGANLDGVVFGTRELRGAADAERRLDRRDRVARRADRRCRSIPIYARRSMRSIGFVRSVAPAARARAGSASTRSAPASPTRRSCEDELRGVLDVPLMEPSFVAEAALQVLNDEETGRAWVVQPNRVVPFRFPNIPGPR